MGDATLSRRVSSPPFSRLLGLGDFSISVRSSSGEEGSMELLSSDEEIPFAYLGSFRFPHPQILESLLLRVGSKNKNRHRAMERIPPMTDAMTRTLVEVLMMWVVALSLTGAVGPGMGVGLAARIAEDKMTIPGPPNGGEVAHGVSSMEVGVGFSPPPWPGEPGVVP